MCTKLDALIAKHQGWLGALAHALARCFHVKPVSAVTAETMGSEGCMGFPQEWLLAWHLQAGLVPQRCGGGAGAHMPWRRSLRARAHSGDAQKKAVKSHRAANSRQLTKTVWGRLPPSTSHQLRAGVGGWEGRA